MNKLYNREYFRQIKDLHLNNGVNYYNYLAAWCRLVQNWFGCKHIITFGLSTWIVIKPGNVINGQKSGKYGKKRFFHIIGD